MATFGFACLIVAFASALAGAVCLAAGHVAKTGAFSRVGRACVAVCAVALLTCCGVLVACFMGGNVSILYVLEQRSVSTDGLAWLYKLSGLWAGRAGSLLFWTFLIAACGATVLARSMFERRASASGSAESAYDERAAALDDVAMAVIAVVTAVFCGVLLFSGSNMPFEPTPASYFEADGSLSAMASMYSMNKLLEHWAMAIHPPLLFLGYAGLTVPFAYAMATLVLGDASALWVERSTRFVLASWLFLGAGIGLGAVWAYIVLGWGGYWGWDPVENASLLSWLVCVALVHTFTVYRQRGAFKRWAVMCACLAFAFVIVATFITRSGIVQSVHAFSGDPVSLVLFGGLIACALIVAGAALAWRWKLFAADVEGADDVENMLSKDAAYYFNNVIMVVFALLLTYMTLTSALPRWLPFGGDSLGTASYEAIARPLGIAYLLILAICPLLAWGKTNLRTFVRLARVPSVCAVALFAALAWWWAVRFVPTYEAMMAKGNASSQALLEAGPGWYYNGLALLGLFVASLLLFNALFMLARSLKAPSKRASAIGGAFAHVAMGVILAGLIGSNMYVFEQTGYLAIDEQAGASEAFEVGDYRLEYADDSVEDRTGEDGTVLYSAVFDVYKDEVFVGQATPSIQLDVNTQQQKLNASVLGFAEEDLFVVYRGVNQNGDFSLDVRINPFIKLVWLGFGMLMVGTACALVGPRAVRTRRKER